MLKRIAHLGAMAALIIVKPSFAVAQGWDGWSGFPFPHLCCGERRFAGTDEAGHAFQIECSARVSGASGFTGDLGTSAKAMLKRLRATGIAASPR